ncbi:Uncharacterised protein [Campylobacter jejuni]|nr:Uncharacterised protein [Campylobacter jejuni]
MFDDKSWGFYFCKIKILISFKLYIFALFPFYKFIRTCAYGILIKRSSI